MKSLIEFSITSFAKNKPEAEREKIIKSLIDSLTKKDEFLIDISIDVKEKKLIQKRFDLIADVVEEDFEDFEDFDYKVTNREKDELFFGKDNWSFLLTQVDFMLIIEIFYDERVNGSLIEVFVFAHKCKINSDIKVIKQQLALAYKKWKDV
jgi:hypothetical protein